MFDFLKQVQQLKQAQEALKNEKIALENQGVRLVMTGHLKIEELHLNASLPASGQETIVKNLINQAIENVQASLAKKLMP